MVEGYKGRIFREQFDASSQGGEPSGREPQLPSQNDTPKEANERLVKKVQHNKHESAPIVNGRLILSSAAHYRRGCQGSRAAALTPTSIMRRRMAK